MTNIKIEFRFFRCPLTDRLLVLLLVDLARAEDSQAKVRALKRLPVAGHKKVVGLCVFECVSG